MKIFEDDVAVVTTRGESKAAPTKSPAPETDFSATKAPPTIPPFLASSLNHHYVRRIVDEIIKRKTPASILGITLLLVAAWFLFRQGHKPTPPANAAVPVTVQTVAEKQVRLWSDFSGRTQAVNFAEIRPEVSGRITEVRFEDGQMVHAGDVLFVIDPAPYQALMNKAQANAAFAKTELDRAAGLVKAQAIAQRLFDERQSASLVADAELAQAKVDYNRAYVKAPISGRISRAEITVGNLVQANVNAPLLTSIVSSNGIYADFEVDEQTYLQSIRGHASDREQEREIPVELTVQGDQERTYKGTIYSFDNHIDNVSGTIRARAKFANNDGSLLPGMFVSIRMGSSNETAMLLVPERAVLTDQNKKYLYVVGKDNKVLYREVTLGKVVGSDRVVLSGIVAGDRVIVDGMQHVRPDVLAAPQEVAPSSTDSTPKPASL